MLCPYSLTIPGGVQGQVMGLARALRKMGHEVRVLGPCDGPPPDSFVTPIGESLPTVANGSIAPLAPDPSAALRTIRVLRDEGFDVLHLHEPLTPGPNLTALVMRTAPIVGTFHAAGESLSYRYLNGPLKGFASAIDARVAVSKDAIALAQRYLGGEYSILPNGVDIDQYRPKSSASISSAAIAGRSGEEEASSTRDPEVFPSVPKSIFFCGRHEPRKGLEVLLEAHSGLPEDVELWVASDGPETVRLRERFGADERILWLGRISENEKAARLRSASVFCAPSLGGESFGVVLIEAMAAETPVVASALDGYMNVATDEKDALLTEPGDSGALRNALRRVLEDEVLGARLVVAGARRAADFSMTALAASYLDIYRKVIEEHRSQNRIDGGDSKRTSLSGFGTRSLARTFPSEIGDISEFARRLRATLSSVLRSTLRRDVSVSALFRNLFDRCVAPLSTVVRRMLGR